MEKEAINYISANNEIYPRLLRQIKHPPIIIYYKGDIRVSHKRCIAIVGSRKSTAYGRWAAENISKELTSCGIVIVSGLAYGIDSYAHHACVNNKGQTIAVLGCSVNICYPEKHKKLAEDILNNDGLIMSEYALGTPPLPHHFPKRNRIISGLSEAIIIPEARLDSGSSITANYALDHGREIYAVPGNIDSTYSMGSNKLLKDGANLVLDFDTLLDDLKLRKCVNYEDFSKILGKEEKIVYDLIKKLHITNTDFLCKLTGIPVSHLAGIITILELKELVYKESGKIFIAK